MIFLSPLLQAEIASNISIAMGVPRVSEWRKLPLSLTELSINTTLQCGQSFRWRKIDDEWFVCGDVRKIAP